MPRAVHAKSIEIELPESDYVCSECFSVAPSMQSRCPQCGSLRVVLTRVLRDLINRPVTVTD